MDKSRATSILRSAYSFDDHIGSITEQIRLLEDGAEKERIKKAVNDVMGIIARDIILPLTKQFPDLNLDPKI
ncbi:MAG: hypothetical protein IT560_08420 [Alphaproteobacteria bacterium]|nr:hypothetical protein [Alphaproteobacteria bacterium]